MKRSKLANLEQQRVKKDRRTLCTCLFGVAKVHEAGAWCWLPWTAQQLVVAWWRISHRRCPTLLRELLAATRMLRQAGEICHFYHGMDQMGQWYSHRLAWHRRTPFGTWYVDGTSIKAEVFQPESVGLVNFFFA